MKIGLQFSKMCQIRYRIHLKFIIVTHTFIVRYPFSLDVYFFSGMLSRFADWSQSPGIPQTAD